MSSPLNDAIMVCGHTKQPTNLRTLIPILLELLQLVTRGSYVGCGSSVSGSDLVTPVYLGRFPWIFCVGFASPLHRSIAASSVIDCISTFWNLRPRRRNLGFSSSSSCSDYLIVVTISSLFYSIGAPRIATKTSLSNVQIWIHELLMQLITDFSMRRVL